MTIERKAYSVADNESKNRRLDLPEIYSREEIGDNVKVFEKKIDEDIRNNDQMRRESRLDSRTKRI